ncbi:cytochrome-c oxidase, cbb3-type subunit I [Opitutus sp. ER46]|uniref:cytochrome-c oxidase, cbb3-type subunit I n=1 Tax=Opitutus sp. ER46 TaxID=2161864 RepID=UPI000D31C6BC|nr:cytochrome-c oxidase, cbb3-type subunit I [Opitutus sp. ER46]PTX95529.1 cytochrome-c oxidase, cbb3-type subunit I [Opitutus sp. ER46]
MSASSAPTLTPAPVTLEFNDRIVRQFVIATIVWAVVGMLAGVFIASQLNFWQLNFETSWLTFGRLRPLHTNAVIFAFVGNMMFAGIYYSTQRLVKARLASDFLSQLHFWGWQAIIVAAAITLPLGLTRGKEYAELIWPINIAVAFIWVVFAVNFFWTLARRREPSLYVALWFYIATIITVAMLYIVNHLSIPTSLLHSYPVFGGVQDALVQWWYGHNAVAFFLTTPILGIMYYYVPKAAERPVYSYRLSVVHFWSLVFVYIWAGPHHLLNTALPGWLQTLGMTFSLMLWAPSWGGMLNGLLTLRGAWHKVMADPVLKFFAAGVTFYGMATFEGPLLAIRSVNALGHYTDWVIGHVHAGALGWNGFMAAGMIYWLVPRLWNRPLHSVALANVHFWIGLVGILLYVAAMWTSGITQGLMLGATAEQGTILAYPNFMDTLATIKPMMLMRVVGGGLYLTGFLLLAYNVWRSVRGAQVVNGTIAVYADDEPAAGRGERLGLFGTVFNPPVMFSVLGVGFACVWMFGGDVLGTIGLVGLVLCVVLCYAHFESRGKAWAGWYDRLLVNAAPFTILTFIAVFAGGAIQIIPTVLAHKAANVEDRRQIPYSPLALAGRDIYVREGCYVCHSQMVRTLVPDVLRYGRAGEKFDYSRLGESIYDHPYQWGSKRTGPDLAHVGGKYTNIWHFQHMENPRMTPGSIMPPYPWLYQQDTDVAALTSKLAVQRKLGVPYRPMTPAEIQTDVAREAKAIAADLRAAGAYIAPEKEIVALIAYLQHLGKYEKVAPAEGGERRSANR